MHPIVCRPDLTVGDGRLDGLLLIGETEVDVFITDEELTDGQLTRLSLITAIHRAPLDGYDQAHAVKSLRDAEPTTTGKALAESLTLDPSEIPRLLSLFDCKPEVQEAARERRGAALMIYLRSIATGSASAVIVMAAESGSHRRRCVFSAGRSTVYASSLKRIPHDYIMITSSQALRSRGALEKSP